MLSAKEGFEPWREKYLCEVLNPRTSLNAWKRQDARLQRCYKQATRLERREASSEEIFFHFCRTSFSSQRVTHSGSWPVWPFTRPSSWRKQTSHSLSCSICHPNPQANSGIELGALHTHDEFSTWQASYLPSSCLASLLWSWWSLTSVQERRNWMEPSNHVKDGKVCAISRHCDQFMPVLLST